MTTDGPHSKRGALQAKAYTTRVGAGPYPTEVFGDLAEDLRRIGAEFGTTTGRPRRVGWLDIPALRYATRCTILHSQSDSYHLPFHGGFSHAWQILDFLPLYGIAGATPHGRVGSSCTGGVAKTLGGDVHHRLPVQHRLLQQTSCRPNSQTEHLCYRQPAAVGVTYD